MNTKLPRRSLPLPATHAPDPPRVIVSQRKTELTSKTDLLRYAQEAKAAPCPDRTSTPPPTSRDGGDRNPLVAAIRRSSAQQRPVGDSIATLFHVEGSPLCGAARHPGSEGH